MVKLTLPKFTATIGLTLILSFLSSAYGETTTTMSNTNPQVQLQTNHGAITLELYPEQAPNTVANFLQYVEAGFYNGTVFHRIIPNFMIQGGGFDQDYQQKPTRDPIDNEADNGLTNDRGTIAMARTSDPNSATAQFFINNVDNAFLNFRSKDPSGWGYCVFGRVTSGIETVDAISQVTTGAVGPFNSDAPTEPVIIESATVLKSANDA